MKVNKNDLSIGAIDGSHASPAQLDIDTFRELTTSSSEAVDLGLGLPELFSFSEQYIRNKIDVVQDQCSCHIDIKTAKQNGNYVGKLGVDKYVIQLDGSIPLQTGISHELAHIIWGTMETKVDSAISAIASSKVHNLFDKEQSFIQSVAEQIVARNYASHALTSYSSEDDSRLHKQRMDNAISVLKARATNLAYNIIEGAHNVLEDIRCESNTGAIYRGTAMDFQELCKAMGESKGDIPMESLNPSTSLLVFRFQRPDLINTNVITLDRVKEISDSVRLTSNMGSIKVLRSWCQAELGKFVDDSIMNSLQDESDDSSLETEIFSLNDKRDKISDQIDDLNSELDQLDEWIRNGMPENEAKTRGGETKENLSNKIESLRKTKDDITDKTNEMRAKRTDINARKAKDETLSDENKSVARVNSYRPHTPRLEAEQALARIDKINDKRERTKTKKKIDELSAMIRQKEENNIVVGSTYTSNLTVDTSMINACRKSLSTIKKAETDSVDVEGYDLLVDEYISGIRNNNLNIFRNRKAADGVSIIVSVDCSGSMGTSLRLCQEIVASMFKATQSMKSIRIGALMWAGSNSNEKVAIREIKSFGDCNRISGGLMGYPLTPTADGIKHTLKLAKRLRGKHKLIFILTDGVPCKKNSNGDDMGQDYIDQTKREMKKLLGTRNIETVVLGIGLREGDQQLMGGDSVCKIVNNMGEATDIIRNKFQKILKSQARLKR